MLPGSMEHVILWDNGGANLQANGAIVCGNPNKTKIRNSVIYRNHAVENLQINRPAQCFIMDHTVVVGLAKDGSATTEQGATHIMADLETETDGRLKPGGATNRGCCIDKAANDALTPRFDYLGTKRPLGAGPDIGFHEVQ